MVYFEKSQPSPDCLDIEKAKANGDYKCGDVLTRIKDDFKNKCYICEREGIVTINVEHFRPHQGNKDLKFNWDNLFLSCGHCNNTKSKKYDNILNCTDINDDVENKLKYIFKSFPYKEVQIEALDKSTETITTKELLLEVYNGTTKLKNMGSDNLKKNINKEIGDFQDLLCDYFKFKDTNRTEDLGCILIRIQEHINRGSSFTAFKRWIILDNDKFKSEFEKYFE